MSPEEKFKLGYDGALKMVGTESAIIWATFNATVSANALVIALTGAALKLFPQIKWGVGVIGIAGVMFCAAWFFTMKRQFAYHSYWIAWARSVEARCLSPEITMLAEGRQYGHGAEVNIPQIGAVRSPWAARTFKVQWMTTAMIAGFAMIYALLLWLVYSSP